MAYLTTFRIQGDPGELLRKKNEHLDPISQPKARELGAIEHIVVKTDDGLMIVNLWETADGSEKMAEAVGPKARELDLPPPTDWQSYEIVQREVPSAD